MKRLLIFLVTLTIILITLLLFSIQAPAYNFTNNNRQLDRITQINTSQLGPVGWEQLAISAIANWNNYDNGFPYISHFKIVRNNSDPNNRMEALALDNTWDGIAGGTWLNGVDPRGALPNGQIIDTNVIVLNLSETWTVGGQPGSWDIITVMRHELGHTLSLGHINSPQDLMHIFSSGWQEVEEVDSDDASGARFIYPNWFVRPSTGTGFSLPANSFTRWYGTRLGDQGLTGDFDGNGATDILVYRPSEAKWYVKLSDGSNFLSNQFTTPVVWGNFQGRLSSAGRLVCQHLSG